MKIDGNITSFRCGDIGGSSRDFQLTNFEVTAVFPDGEIELAFNYNGMRYFAEFNAGKLLTAALQRAEDGHGER